MTTQRFIQRCYSQHDVVCNQKYANDLPYSFHLKMVKAQAEKFINLIYLPLVAGNPIMGYSEHGENTTRRSNVFMGCAGHDLIEDARLSYNDVKEWGGEEVAEIIFLCTEMRGRNRSERKSDQFYRELATNELAVFVKLCDIMANTTYSILSNSSPIANDDIGTAIIRSGEEKGSKKERKEKEMKEYILCAAIHFDNGKHFVHQPVNIKTGFVVCGRRHHNCFMIYSAIREMFHGTTDKDADGYPEEVEQGFLTNLDRFVDRKEANKIAFYAGQFKPDAVGELFDSKGRERILFSEDLY